MNPKHPDDDASRATAESTSAARTVIATAIPKTTGGTPKPRSVSIHSLDMGTRLHEFELTGHVGEGGFSIVYRAWDHSLERIVALKEYLPGSIASRDQDTHVGVRTESLQSTFDAGLRSFINEGKLLASFDHPSLVKVYRFWESHGTAYMVMPFYEGLTLKDTVQAMPAPPSQAWILEVLAPLAEALSYIHARSCYHRDIAPDNILMLADSGRPLLLDFGAARRVITDMSQALTVIVKAGYAPIEQYAEVPDMRQGPWTDVHALAAVVHWMVTGKKPVAAISRMLKDSYVPLAQQGVPGYSTDFLAAIDRGLALLPANRTRSIEEFAADIGLRIQAPTASVTAARAPTAGGDSSRTTMTRSATFLPPPREPAIEAPPSEAPLSRTAPAADDDDDLTIARPPAAARSTPAPEPTPEPEASADLDFSIDDLLPEPPPPAPAAPRTVIPAAPAPVRAARPEPDAEPDEPPVIATPAPRPSRTPWIALGGGVVLAGAIAAGWLATRSPAPPPRVEAPAAPASVPLAAPPPLPLPEPASAAAPASAPEVAPSAAVVVPPPAVAEPAPAPASRQAPARASTPRAAPVHDAPVNANAAECARIMQRLSLGESGAELLERATALHCK